MHPLVSKAGTALLILTLLSGCRGETSDQGGNEKPSEPKTQQEAPREEGVLRPENITLERAPLKPGTIMTRSSSRRTDVVWKEGEGADATEVTEVIAASDGDTIEVVRTDGSAITEATVTWDRLGSVRIRGGEEDRQTSVLQGRTLTVSRDESGTLQVTDAHGRQPEPDVFDAAVEASQRIGRHEDPLGAVLAGKELRPGYRISVPQQAIDDHMRGSGSVRGQDFRFVYQGVRQENGVDLAIFEVDQTFIASDDASNRVEETRLTGEWRIHRVTGWTTSVELQGKVEARIEGEPPIAGAGTTTLTWTMDFGD